ncbi:MAG: hypothetical protein WD981_07100 [Gaiellaceae bacterium]
MQDRPIGERGRAILEAAGVTHRGKQRLAESKLERVREAIDAELARLCATCAARRPGDGRELVVVPAAACTYCGGSANARAVRELVESCKRAGVRRLVVVGGSPSVRQDLAERLGALELRLIDGTERRTAAEARGDVGWADLLVVCGASELSHKISRLYTRDERARRKLVTASRRGVEAIAGAVVEQLRRKRES